MRKAIHTDMIAAALFSVRAAGIGGVIMYDTS